MYFPPEHIVVTCKAQKKKVEMRRQDRENDGFKQRISQIHKRVREHTHRHTQTTKKVQFEKLKSKSVKVC